jgi:hypothetical protein
LFATVITRELESIILLIDLALSSHLCLQAKPLSMSTAQLMQMPLPHDLQRPTAGVSV